LSEPSSLDELIELIGPLIEPLVDRQEKVEKGLQAQEQVLVEIGGQLESLLRKGDDKKKPSPWNLYQGDPSQIAEMLAEIDQWIPWFNATYGAGLNNNMIPSCWFRHPMAVAHLMGLYVAWKAANDGAKAPTSDLVYWNLRYLPDVLDVVNAPGDRGGLGGCRREHREQERVDPVPEPLHDKFKQWLTESYPADDSTESSGQEIPVVEDLPAQV
jgi:hypothetical protein